MKSTFISSDEENIIVLLHGNSSSSKVFKDLRLNNSVLIPTLSGHEINENPDDNIDFSLQFYKQELISLINSYDQPILLVGNSLGGHLAMEIANQIKKLKGLIIFSAPPVKKPINFEEAFIPVDALQTFLKEKSTDEEIASAASVTVYEQKFTEQIVSDFKNSNPKVRSATAEDLFNGNWSDQYKSFTNLKCPKVIVSGSHDPSVNKEYLKKVVKESSHNTSYIELENCGHYPTLERPEEMSTIINHLASDVFKLHLK
ncbi:MAG: alpha/beta hydrolase [Nonlabens ulvanivorans]